MQQSSAIQPSASKTPSGGVSPWRRTLGRTLILGATLAAALVLLLQIAQTAGWLEEGFSTWRPVALAFVGWATALMVGVVLTRGARGEQAVFLLPAVLLTLGFVIFPTIFALYVAFTDWNLSGSQGRSFNGLDNFRSLFRDDDFWSSLLNMAIYLVGVLFQYLIAFGLALLLNQNIRGRRLFRIIFLLPFMLSPVAVSFMIGKSLFNSQYGPVKEVLARIGIENPAFWEDPWLARMNIMLIVAWYSIPFVMVLLLAGLQAIPHEVLESAKIDGANPWQTFANMVFPLMLPVSLTAVVLRMIFELKLIDVVRVVTGGGPGGATDTVTLFIYREGIEQANVGYATALSQFYLVCIIVFVTVILAVAGRWVRKFA
jgi:multiple sugar transport system permease protein